MSVLAVAGSIAPLILALPARASEGVETSSKGVTLEQVPEAARKTLLEKAGPLRIRELEEKVVDGRTVYEVELMIDGEETEVVVASDGRLVNFKGSDQEAKDQAIGASREEEPGWRRTFDVDRKNLGSVGGNPYFPLTPGLKLHLTGEHETVVLSVLPETKVVDGVETRVVEERETADGELVEISRNYFAVDKITGDVYYFGEDVDIYEDGKVVSHDGAWLSGTNGAKFGLILPGKPTLGDKYYLEMAPGAEAVERVEIVAVDATLETPLRTFSNVVKCRETDMTDNGASHKWYAAGVGMIADDDMRVVKIEEPKP
jgi:hypothetical protein